MTAPDGRRRVLSRVATIVLIAVLWWWPPPDGLTLQAWHLFAIFAGAIVSVVVDALPILTASVLAIAVTVLTGLLEPEAAYAGFANGTILLIVVTFLVAGAVVKCGLGARAGHWIVGRFGKSTLGLSYSIFLLDGIIAPAFPSNTARSGVLYPLAFSLADAVGVKPDRPERRRLGGFLMYSGIASLSLSSALWLTAMVANPLGAEIARGAGVDIGFGRWLIAASVPTLLAMVLLPIVLSRLIRPEVRATPEAPAAARAALAALGPLTRQEWIVAIVFVCMVALWATAATIGLDSTAIAFLGLGALLATGVITLQDIGRQGDVLATFIWFAVLFTLSSQLNELGFMRFLGERMATALSGLASPTAGFDPGRRLHPAALPLCQPDRAPAGAVWRVPRGRRQAGRQPDPARVSAAVRDQLLLDACAAGIEREPAVCRERLSDTGRALSARRDHHHLHLSRVRRSWARRG